MDFVEDATLDWARIGDTAIRFGLSASPAAVLDLLIEREGRLVPYQDIAERLMEVSSNPDRIGQSNVRTNAKHVRKALGKDGSYELVTIEKLGFCLRRRSERAAGRG